MTSHDFEQHGQIFCCHPVLFLESGSGINRNSGRHNDKPSTFIHLGDVVETTKTGENILVGKKKKNHSNTQC